MQGIHEDKQYNRLDRRGIKALPPPQTLFTNVVPLIIILILLRRRSLTEFLSNICELNYMDVLFKTPRFKQLVGS